MSLTGGEEHAYTLEVTNGIVHSCSCPAAEYGDSVCKHRACWYHVHGMLDLEEHGQRRTGSDGKGID